MGEKFDSKVLKGECNMLPFVKEVKVMNITFTVEFVKEKRVRKALKVKKMDRDLQIYFGCVDFKNSEILINKDVNYERQLVTLWHEINHIIVFDYNAGYEGEPFDEERVVDCFSKGIVQVLRDNPCLRDLY